MPSIRTPSILIIGRNVGLGAAIAEAPRARDARVVFDDPDTGALVDLGPSPPDALGMAMRRHPHRIGILPVDRLFRIMGPPASTAPVMDVERRNRLWTAAFSDWGQGQHDARHPFHATFVLPQPLPRTSCRRLSEEQRQQLVASQRDLSAGIIDGLPGTQCLFAYVDMHPDEDWYGPPSEYDRAVADALQGAVDAQASLGAAQPFRSLQILRQPDGRPLVQRD